MPSRYFKDKAQLPGLRQAIFLSYRNVRHSKAVVGNDKQGKQFVFGKAVHSIRYIFWFSGKCFLKEVGWIRPGLAQWPFTATLRVNAKQIFLSGRSVRYAFKCEISLSTFISCNKSLSMQGRRVDHTSLSKTRVLKVRRFLKGIR